MRRTRVTGGMFNLGGMVLVLSVSASTGLYYVELCSLKGSEKCDWAEKSESQMMILVCGCRVGGCSFFFFFFSLHFSLSGKIQR